MRKIITGLILLSAMSFNILAENSHAYREELVTPHWEWELTSPEKPLTVLFLTNNLAAHEPEELAQRFPGIKPLVAPVVGDSYKNVFEVKWLSDSLNSKLDLIVVTARELLRDLPQELKDALVAKLKGGTPLLCLVDDPGWRVFLKEQLEPDSPAIAKDRDWIALLKAHPGTERGDQLGRLLPLGALKLRSQGGKLLITEFNVGKGLFFWVAGYDLSWIYPNAFTPNIQAECIYDYEAAIALATRIMRFAAGVRSDVQVKTLDVSEDAVAFTLERPVNGRLRWELYTEFCEKLASGVELFNGSDKATVRIPHGRRGKQILRWSLEADGKLQDFGMTELKLPVSASFATATVPEFNRRGEPVEASWTLQGDAGEAMVRGEVFDPDGRLMGRLSVPAKNGKASIAAWMPAFVTHELRLKLVSGDNVWDERRLELNVQANRSEDSRRFNVTIWDEGVYNVSKWRLRRLRMLGVDAMATQGSTALCSAGLRPNPVNVCVPPNIRNKNVFDPVERGKKLVEMAAKNAKYSPLGYLLCDEPNFPHWQPFRDWAANLARQGDPGARVGFSGAWLGVGHRSEDIASCDNLIAYSPHHLYTPNLWLGVERDLLRSFVKPGSLYSCWTQYCPWYDCEPYTRTMPWLLLFEGGNGLSVFGALEFRALDADLRPTHEARWWSEEVKRLHAGTGAQLIAMSRDIGGVRVLFPEQILSGGASKASVENWARAFNELRIPYKFISSVGIKGLDPKQVKLLLCPVVPVLAADDIERLKEYVKAGGTLVASAPTGLLSNMDEPSQVEFWKTDSDRTSAKPADKKSLADLADISELFGFKRNIEPGVELSKLSERMNLQANVPLDISWPGGAWGSDSAEAGSGGDILIPTTASVLASFIPKKGVDIPDYLQAVVKSPAALENKLGAGKAFYLNFSCSSERLKLLIQWLGTQIDFRKCATRVIAGGQDARNVYLFPMSGGGVEMLGVVQDYIKTPPAKMNKDKETVIYFNHGPELWASVPAELELSESRHVYDARQGCYIGHGKNAAFSLQAGRPELFAMLPYKVSAVDAKFPAKVKAGEIFKVAASIASDKKPLGDHVVNFQMVAPDGEELASNAKDVMLKAGAGSFDMQLPYNTQVGKWSLVARDAVTGTQNSYALEVESSVVAPSAPEMVVKQIPLVWKEGTWQDYKADNAADLDKVKVDLSPLTRTKMKYGADIGKWHLQFKAELKSRTGYYNMRYDVNNDYESNGWDDKRQVSGGGLGIDRPVPYIWFTNGFLTVMFDDKPVTNFAISSVKEIRSGSAGGFEAVWDSPHGKLTGEFMMELSRDALLVRLIAAPGIPVKKISVKLRSYPGGFGSPANTKRFSRTMRGRDYKTTKLVPGADTEFAMLGCDINDVALGKGEGPGGIHLMPGEWDSISFGLDNLLEKTVDLKPGQNASLHFALRIFPKQTNTNCFDNLRDSHKDVQETLRNIYGGSHVY